MDPAQQILDALKTDDEATARAILQKNRAVANARGPNAIPLLQMALYARAPKVVDALLKAGATPTVHETAIMGDAARLRQMIAADKTLLQQKSADGAPPLHFAAHFGKRDALLALINLGADLDALAGPPFNNMALHAACAGNATACAEALLAAGAKPDEPDKNGYTPLMIAAANGNADIVRALLARGARRDATSPDGKTARDHAEARGEDEVAGML